MVLLNAMAAVVLMAAAGLAALSSSELPDQLGGRDSLAAHREHVVMVVVVDARRLGSVRRWEEALLKRFPDLHLLTVADVNEKQPVDVQRVAQVLARRVPPDVRVSIDAQRLWALGLELDTAVPNLLLVDAGGELVAQFRGRYSPELMQTVGDRLAALEAGT